MEIKIVNKPSSKFIYKPGINATHYFEYCEEVGCDVWDILKSLHDEPLCLWLPNSLKKPNTSTYVQGVEFPLDYDAPIPEGFDVLTLPQGQYLMFNGPKYNDENFMQAIEDVHNFIDLFNPNSMGFEWNNDLPAIQLEPISSRGYIELRGVKPLL